MSPYDATTETDTARACAPQQEKLPQWEAPALQLESSPYSPELERACMQQQTLSAAKK